MLTTIALRNKADLYLDKTSILLFAIATFSSLIRTDVNVGIALISYFFVNKKIQSKYSLRLKDVRKFIVLVIVTLVFDLIWIGIWSHGYQRYHNTPSVILQFAFVMTFICLLLKIVYAILLTSYWNDQSFCHYKMDEKDDIKMIMNHETYHGEIELQNEHSNNWDMNELSPKSVDVNKDEADAIHAKPIVDEMNNATLNQDAQTKYMTYDESDNLEREDELELGSNINRIE